MQSALKPDIQKLSLEESLSMIKRYSATLPIVDRELFDCLCDKAAEKAEELESDYATMVRVSNELYSISKKKDAKLRAVESRLSECEVN
ncbi:MAG: hypothetical protein ACREBS_00440 [Nitrososphaerales archaeon]